MCLSKNIIIECLNLKRYTKHCVWVEQKRASITHACLHSIFVCKCNNNNLCLIELTKKVKKISTTSAAQLKNSGVFIYLFFLFIVIIFGFIILCYIKNSFFVVLRLSLRIKRTNASYFVFASNQHKLQFVDYQIFGLYATKIGKFFSHYFFKKLPTIFFKYQK